jgi:hypothetical protein
MPLRSAAVLATLLALATPLVAGPPWIAIEYPANPWDPASRGAVLLVHAFHHGTPMAFPVSGTAEGLVDGRRRSVPLTLERTSRTGVYAVRQQWADEGDWTLVLTVTQGRDDVAQALVQVAGSRVLAVDVPTRSARDGARQVSLPRRATDQEVEASLRNRPAQPVRLSSSRFASAWPRLAARSSQALPAESDRATPRPRK